MVSVFHSRSSGPGLSPGWGHCVVFLGRMLNLHSAMLGQNTPKSDHYTMIF